MKAKTRQGSSSVFRFFIEFEYHHHFDRHYRLKLAHYLINFFMVERTDTFIVSLGIYWIRIVNELMRRGSCSVVGNELNRWTGGFTFHSLVVLFAGK